MEFIFQPIQLWNCTQAPCPSVGGITSLKTLFSSSDFRVQVNISGAPCKWDTDIALQSHLPLSNLLYISFHLASILMIVFPWRMQEVLLGCNYSAWIWGNWVPMVLCLFIDFWTLWSEKTEKVVLLLIMYIGCVHCCPPSILQLCPTAWSYTPGCPQNILPTSYVLVTSQCHLPSAHIQPGGAQGQQAWLLCRETLLSTAAAPGFSLDDSEVNLRSCTQSQGSNEDGK